MKNAIAILLSMILYCPYALAQSGRYGSNVFDHLLIKQEDPFHRLTPEDVEGSPYIHDSFFLSKVITTKGVFDSVPLRFDANNGWMEFRRKGETFILDPLPEVMKIEMPAETYTVEAFLDHGKPTLGFFVLLDTVKELKLLKMHEVKFQERIPPKALEARGKPATYIPSPDQFYYRFGFNPALKIEKVSKMADYIPTAYKKELISCVKRKKPEVREEDLRKLWDYLKKTN